MLELIFEMITELLRGTLVGTIVLCTITVVLCACQYIKERRDES